MRKRMMASAIALLMTVSLCACAGSGNAEKFDEYRKTAANLYERCCV